MSTEIIQDTLVNREIFMDYINKNEGVMVLKFGADWCGPCQRVKEDIYKLFNMTPENVTCFDINVDNCSDLYFYLKRRKQINGIPAILVYHKDNKSFAPNISLSGANIVEITSIFNVINKMGSTLLL